MKTVVTAIVPCYNEEAALPYFLREIRKVADAMSATYDLNFEFLFVNDGSKDSTLHILRTAAKEDSRVRYISFSRNFGKEAAMYEYSARDCAPQPLKLSIHSGGIEHPCRCR